MIDLGNYPLTKQFLSEHPGMTLEQAYEYLKKQGAELIF